MRDCADARMRDLLPDLLHDRLPASVRAEVRAHVDACEECRLELELLHRVRAAAVVPRVDALRIASALPPYRVRPLWRRSMESPQLRVAAAILLLAGSATVLTLVGRGSGPDRTAVQPPGAGAPTVAAVPTGPPATVGASSGAGGRARVTVPVELAVGETFQDLTESELRALLDELGRFEAVTPSEAEIVLPSLGRSGS